jgi:hypothetical protein
MKSNSKSFRMLSAGDFRLETAKALRLCGSWSRP